jgi:hypothetical protein
VDTLQPIAELTLRYLTRVASAVGFQLLVLLGPGVVIGALLHALAVVIDRRAQAAFGFRRYFLAAGWLGTAVHEAGHAAFALLFGHRIRHIKWFDLHARDGTLGHVRHEYDPRSVYQRLGLFFIGVGPLVVGGAVVYVVARQLLGAALFVPARTIPPLDGVAMSPGDLARVAGQIWHAVAAFSGLLLTWSHVTSWQFWLFVYFAFAVGGGLRLSPPDLALAARGLGLLVALLAAANAATLWAGDFATRYVLVAARFVASFYAVLLLVAAANALAAAVVLLIPAGIRRARTARRAARA